MKRTARKHARDRKRAERDRMLTAGFRVFTAWVHPDDWQQVRTLCETLRAGRNSR